MLVGATSCFGVLSSLADNDIDLQKYSCAQFLADVGDPSDGGKLLKSLMMVAWATGYAAAHDKASARADSTAIKIIAATLGEECRKTPNKNATKAAVDAIADFEKSKRVR